MNYFNIIICIKKSITISLVFVTYSLKDLVNFYHSIIGRCNLCVKNSSNFIIKSLHFYTCNVENSLYI